MAPQLDEEDKTSVILRLDDREPEKGVDGKRLKFAQDEITVLVPQPNEDPKNPVQ
jgi:hypothetical protein